MESVIQGLPYAVDMPPFRGDRLLYMEKVRMDQLVLPIAFADWSVALQQIARQLPEREITAYVTIDEKWLKPNQVHRRPGVHVDYNWHEGATAHDGAGSGRHTDGMPYHRAVVPTAHPDHVPVKGVHDLGSGHGHRRHPGHDHYPGASKDETHGGMLMLSNVYACNGWRGRFEGNILPGGDCSQVSLDGLEMVPMDANTVYYVNALGIHEGIAPGFHCNRQLLRINLHPNHVFPWKEASCMKL
jgi:hypothetical protein